MARPQLIKERPVGLRIQPDLYNKLERSADEHKRSISREAEFIIEEYFNKKVSPHAESS